MNARERKQCQAFVARVEARIAQELNLARSRGIRRSARAAAARRARDLSLDLDYLRTEYGFAAGQGRAQ